MADRKRQEKKQKKQSAGAPAWMVTYSDMVTLLLTFFVLLLSMANMDTIKFEAAAGSLKTALGFMRSADSTEIQKPQVIEFSPINDDYATRVYKRIEIRIQQLRINREIELVKDRGAVVLRVNQALLFDPGESTLKPDGKPVLRHVADLVRPLPFQLRVEGHTDDIPLAMGGKTNWDLSVERAVAVVKFMAGESLLPLDRLAAVGYGAQKPIESNKTAKGRALNRRVEFVLESSGGQQEKLPYLIDMNSQNPF